MPVKEKATPFDRDYEIQPGMDEKLMKDDAKTFKVDVEFLTGAKFYNLGDMSGPQVGPGADADALGEDSHARITYPPGMRGKRK